MTSRPHATAAATLALQAALLATALLASAQSPSPLVSARQALAAKQYIRAKQMYEAFLHDHPESVDAQLGVADAELGAHEYEAAELAYRRVVAAQPQLWVAHKNLVIVEAELGRWSEFDRERAVLRAARERQAPGISASESDIVDSFEVDGHRWIAREYYQPVGRSQARFNFERFSPEGRAEEYVSLEPTAAAEAALKPGDLNIGAETHAAPRQLRGEFSLNWYRADGHGTIARYPGGEPSYERARADLIRWLRRHPSATPRKLSHR